MSMLGKRTKKTGVCPRCSGTGRARAFNREQKYDEKLRKKAEILFDKGLTLREIAREVGVNHPQSIKNILSYK